VVAVDAVVNGYRGSINEKVQVVYSQQVQIEKVAKLLQQECNQFSKQSSKWLDLYRDFNEAVKVCATVF